MSDRGFRNFNLVEFGAGDRTSNLKISGNVRRSPHALSMNYYLYDPAAIVLIPPQAERSLRKHNLWEETCFELFLRIKDSEPYWEFNLSPSGHWNVYHFDTYRQAMREELAFTTLPFSFHTRSDSLSLAIDLDLQPIIQPKQILKIAVSAVTKFKDGNIAYWALVHPGMSADFHDRDSFILEMLCQQQSY
ncbi:DOMON-like domain-containing protein [Pseudanabaena sp. PCC 6802]|uniref:DOMON-like domain-containing protein n=1 Tax=Pseudanabaena sp. PCC 6802 TaxID=118173 RepID=UPI000346688A|nr:DOMON-like domain-containing protein [Pseudanabaena sp. PCC 6802]